MSTSEIVAAQENLWFVIPAFFSFAVYVVTMFGETNRLPFDLADIPTLLWKNQRDLKEKLTRRLRLLRPT